MKRGKSFSSRFVPGREILLRLSAILGIAILLSLSSPAWVAAKKRAAPAPVEKKAAPAREHNSLNPPDGSHINNPRPSISAEYEDEGAGINPVNTKLFIDGMDITASAQSTASRITYIPMTSLADGVHQVKLDISDEAGNSSTVAWTFTLRTQPAEVKIRSHKLFQYVNRSPIIVSGTVDDVRSRVAVNGIPAVVEGNAFKATVDIIEGKNTIIAETTDSFGNTGNDYVAVFLDSKQPMISITSHLPDSLTNARVVTVSGIVDKRADSVTVSTNTGGRPTRVETTDGAFIAKEVTLEEGPNIITARTVSSSGNVGTSTIKIVLDTVPPYIALTVPRDMITTNKKTITVAGTVDDPAALVEVNGTPVQVSKGAFSLSSLNLTEGNNTITASAVDPAGNRARPATIAVVLKTVPPPPPSFVKQPSASRKSAVTLAGTAEPGSQVEVFMNSRSKGAVKADEKGLFSLKASLIEGNNVFTAVATDSAGNVSATSSTVNVFLDTTPPKVL
jgi:hypothetical protein